MVPTKVTCNVPEAGKLAAAIVMNGRSAALKGASSTAVDTPNKVGAAAVKTAAARYLPVAPVIPIATVEEPNVAEAFITPYKNLNPTGRSTKSIVSEVVCVAKVMSQ